MFPNAKTDLKKIIAPSKTLISDVMPLENVLQITDAL